jgi:cathepsin B
MKLLTDKEEMKAELIANGPMMVGFIIYEDFMTYATGIYKPTTASILGAHAVKLIGYGYDG